MSLSASDAPSPPATEPIPAEVEALREHLAPIQDLRTAAQVLSWDQETYMPSGGAEARAHQLSTLQRLAHERFVADETGRLLSDAEAAADGLDPESDAASLVRVTRRDFDRERTVPSDLVARMSQAVSRAKEAWKSARADDDFDAFAPHLETIVELNVEKAEAIGYKEEAYDALLDEYEPGMTTAEVADTFDRLRKDLVPLVDAIADAPQIDDSVLQGSFPVEVQKAFGEDIIREIGYDFDRGRQDVSAHPFTTSFGVGDVRLTTRFDENHFGSSLYSTLHEAGHGMYEQGINPDLERTPLAEGASLGIHESQSRFVENQIGRSRAFWERYAPMAREAFPDALADAGADDLYRAVNRVEPSLIRVEADEVTYNLHVMLRFELERGLVRGDVDVRELPDLWRDKMDTYLGVVPDTDANGVLQDVHWSLGAIGYFPTYALGTLMSAQIAEAMEADLGDLDARVSRGEFQPILDWLRTHIHRHGRKYTAPELLKRATGEAFSADAWLQSIREKYGALYDASLPQPGDAT